MRVTGSILIIKALDRLLAMRVFISDLDGTLVHVPVNWLEVRIALSNVLGFEVTSIFEALRSVRARDEGLYRRLSRLIENYEVNAMRSLEEIKGSKELLRLLKSMEVKIAIVTLQSEKSLKMALDVSGLTPYVDVYVTRDEELNRANQIRIALRKLGAEVGRDLIVFMGDRQTDLEAGRSLGIPTIIVNPTTFTPLDAINTIAENLKLHGDQT